MKTHCWSSNLLSLLLLLGMALPAAAAVAAPAAPVNREAAAEKSSADAPLLSDKIREAMQDRRYADAVKAIDEAAKAKDAPRDYLTYLKGRALHLDGKYDAAIAIFDLHAKEFPKSPWARRARFAKAVSLARKGDFHSAEVIYRAEAEFLLSSERKQQIADIYLEFADAYFKPPKEEQKPDYAKALEFYKKALETGTDWWKKIDIELLIGQCQQNLGKPAEAAALFEQFIKDHPRDWDGAVCVTVWTPALFSKEFSRRDIEARYRLGQCRLAEGNAREARRVWQDLLAKYVDSQSPRVADAQFDLARTWNIPNPGDDEQLNLGTSALRVFLERFPKHAHAGQAHLEIAQSYLNRGRPADATTALKQFLADPRCRECKELPEGQNLLGRAYQAQKEYTNALAAWREFLAKYPAHKDWTTVQQAIVESEYLMAYEQFAAKKYAEANKLFGEFLTKYPLDSRGPDILLLMNQKNVAEEKWEDAISAWRRLVSKYPGGTNQASRAQYLIGATLEYKLGKLEEALEEYRKVTGGSSAGEAQMAAARLTAKTMTIATERVFRSDEAPKIKLVTRNIESVTVRAYKVDLETYFRKMHLARGVEGLDISLIDPDATFEYKVPNYVKHKEIESEIEVPQPYVRLSSLTGVRDRGRPGDAVPKTSQPGKANVLGQPGKANVPGGVMAVTVNSKALEATTMVVQSDLDVIVKSSRDEVFVFAENMLTGKPWPGVRLLVSNGHEVIGEGMTDALGVFRKDYRDFKSSTSSVLAETTAPGGSLIGGLPGASVGAVHTSDTQPVPNSAPGTTPLPPGTYPSTAPTPPSSGLAPPPPSYGPAAPTAPDAGPVVPAPIAPEPALPRMAGDDRYASAPVQTNAAYAPPPSPYVPGSTGRASLPPPPIAAESRGQPINSDDIRVFATAGSNVASNMLNLQGVGVAQGLTDKGYIYTDRPAYRAGQLVNVRGCLRRAVNDAYVIDKDKSYTVEVFDARNRPIREEKVQLNAFGSFHVHFVLPPNSPQGQYRLLVHDNESQNFQGTFIVQEYRLEPIRLVVDTPRRIYYRGEPIEGTIRAEFYYGAPVAGREVRYRLADDRIETAKTDAKGEVKIKLPTREYSESQILPLSVQLPENNVATQVNFVLAAQGFSIGISTVRPVYVTGESFEATVNIRDAENKPLAQKLSLKVLERTLVNGRRGERIVEEHALTTGDDGKARQTLKLDKGGLYLLRAEAIDRFHNPITGEARVQISGEDDLVRLRILADRHTYKAGDVATVRLHWRDAPALALVTYQGARILDYRLVELKTGVNELSVPMTANLAPNFELAVAVMTNSRSLLPEGTSARRPAALVVPPLGGSAMEIPPKGGTTSALRPTVRFHTAESPFTVERDLRVKITTKSKSPHPLPLSPPLSTAGPRARGDVVKPGDEVEVTVITTDPQGKPVAAELSLAMVEQSILERFASPLPGIGDFFRGAERQAAMRSTSSITFSYRPATQPINPRLLAEKDREELAKEEDESRRAAIAVAGSPPMSGTGSFTSGSGPTTMAFADGSVPRIQFGLDVNGNAGLVGGEVAMEPTDMPYGERHEQISVSGIVANGGILTYSADGNLARQQLKSSVKALAQQQAGQQSITLPAEAQMANVYASDRIANGTVLSLGNGNVTGDRSNTYDLEMSAQVPQGQAVYRLAHSSPTVTGKALAELSAQNQRQLTVVDKSGLYRSLRLSEDGRLDEKKAAALAAELNAAGATLLSSLLPQETGYWNPAVTTGPDGKTTLTLTVPERSTAWKFLAKGLSAETLAGEATDELTVKKDLFGEIRLPMAFTDGDTAEIPVTVHNDAIEKGTIEVVLRTTIGGHRVEETKTLQVTAKGLQEVTFKEELKRATGPGQNPTDRTDRSDPSDQASVQFELVVRAAGREDIVQRSLPLRPYGVPVFTAASGSSTADGTVWLELPAGVPADAAEMQIIVGPTVERSLLDIVLAPAPWCQLESSRLASGLDSAAGDVMASLGLQKLLGALVVPPLGGTGATGAAEAGTTSASGPPEALALDSRVRSSLSLLLSAQNDDGGWSWTGTTGAASNRYATSRIVWAVTLAKKAGYVVPDAAYSKAVGYLQNQSAATANNDYESKAILLHVLAVAGNGDFALANRLYRDRNSLTPAALAYLGLSFAAMDRKATAQEILGLLEKRNLDDRTALPWSSSPAELRALYALALQEVKPAAPKVKELVDWLLAHRTGNRWTPEKATGPAALALCRWFADSRFTAERYKLTVFVNDVRIKVLDVDPAAGSQTVDVPRKFLKPGDTARQRINFQMEGRGRYTYQCVLGGSVPADKLKNTTKEWHVARYYEPAPLELDGREIPRGFGVLEGSYQTFRNPLDQLPVGRRGMVNIELRRNTWNQPEERQEYLVVTEPIPSGASVIEKSVSGPFEHVEIGPGEITFYIGNRTGLGTIHYELYGYVPGVYRIGPTLVRNAHRPEQLQVTKPKTLTVLQQGGKSADDYRLTPQELYELGKRLAAKALVVPASAGPDPAIPPEGGTTSAAITHLTDLLEHWNLQPNIYKEVVQTLLDIHLEIGPPAKIVHYFEIIKEKWPSEEIPFAKIVKVGAAYHAMGEYERSYLIFRATVESNFARESEVAGFLESQGELLRSVEAMSGLLRNYPPEGYIAAASYSLAQQVAAKAPEAANDAKLRQQKINKVDLLRRAWTMLEGFLTAWPDDPAADQAAFASANALLDLKAYREAAAACGRYAKRFARSDLVDSYWYIIGYCDFATGQHKEALAMCRKVADSKHLDKTTGRETDSPNKWQAIYILGQVYHGLGAAADAIREYRLVEDRFADAKEAIAYFLRKEIDLPEVTTVKPGEAAAVELKFRNIAACDVKVYRIDLMKFSLLRRNLGGIAQINLAGIRPLHETSERLGDGKDYRDRTQKLALPLKDEGAYLVVCRGDDLHASGLVLVTPLAVEVQEDAVSGRVRTTVKDVKADHYVNNVQVKVIGSNNNDFVDGDTDLRGVFVADGIHGRSTVIARLEPSRYAFFRGKTELVPSAPACCVPAPSAAPAPPPAANEPAMQQPAARKPMSKEGELLENLQMQNKSYQGQQQDNLKRIYDNKAKGVEVKAAF
jgi:alpha-2-macroglobulin